MCFASGLKGPVSKEGFENALYMMDIGHNDMVGVAHTPSDQWDKKITEIVGEVRQAISVSSRRQHTTPLKNSVQHTDTYRLTKKHISVLLAKFTDSV